MHLESLHMHLQSSCKSAPTSLLVCATSEAVSLLNPQNSFIMLVSHHTAPLLIPTRGTLMLIELCVKETYQQKSPTYTLNKPVNQQKLHTSTPPAHLHPNGNPHPLIPRKAFRYWKLTSDISLAKSLFPPKFLIFCAVVCWGRGQLLVLYHQRRIREPTEWPDIWAERFQNRQPWRARFQSVPWRKGRMTC